MFNSFNNVNFNTKIERYYQNTNENSSISSNIVIQNKTVSEEIIDKNIWKIEIPKINLSADISNGTTSEILNNYVGHFEETPKEYGNVVLAAHNRGYNVNYFARLKELEIGDEVIYFFNGQKRLYKVNEKTIIKDTQWNNLENTKDNRLTLITCVENKPELRRCVQAIEV